MAEWGPEIMNIHAIRRRLERDYVFDRRGDVVVDQDTDLAWALDQLTALQQQAEADQERIRVLEGENSRLRESLEAHYHEGMCPDCDALVDGEMRSHRETTEKRIRVLKKGLIAVAALDGIVFASDSKERPMIAQSVVRHIANAALAPAPEEG